MNASARIGLFGGSFDPPHQAHLALARAALDELALDALHWLPAGQPWQKRRELAASGHRAAMVAATIAGEPRFLLDRRELEREGPSYTIDTVRALRAERPAAELWLLLGQDQYQGLASWRSWRELLLLVKLGVAVRDGAAVQAPPALHGVPHEARALGMPAMNTSSTAIRAHIGAGGNARELAPAMVTPEVAGYIDSHRLYRDAGASSSNPCTAAGLPPRS